MVFKGENLIAWPIKYIFHSTLKSNSIERTVEIIDFDAVLIGYGIEINFLFRFFNHHLPYRKDLFRPFSLFTDFVQKLALPVKPEYTFVYVENENIMGGYFDIFDPPDKRLTCRFQRDNIHLSHRFAQGQGGNGVVQVPGQVDARHLSIVAFSGNRRTFAIAGCEQEKE